LVPRPHRQNIASAHNIILYFLIEKLTKFTSVNYRECICPSQPFLAKNATKIEQAPG
jgi:hypothetical protein